MDADRSRTTLAWMHVIGTSPDQASSSACGTLPAWPASVTSSRQADGCCVHRDNQRPSRVCTLCATATWVCRSGSPARLSRWVNATATRPRTLTCRMPWGPVRLDRSGEAASPGDRRRRPPTESALAEPPCPHRDPARRTGHPISGGVIVSQAAARPREAAETR
jgi:hypothetical protein